MLILSLKLSACRLTNNSNYKGKYMAQYDPGNAEDPDPIDSPKGACSLLRAQNLLAIGIHRKGQEKLHKASCKYIIKMQRLL